MKRPRKQERRNNVTPRTIDMEKLVADTPNFHFMRRLDALDYTDSPSNLLQEINYHVVENGLPVIIGNWHRSEHWERRKLSKGWLAQHLGSARVSVRDLDDSSRSTILSGKYLKDIRKLLSARKKENINPDTSTSRTCDTNWPCPSEWQQALTRILPHDISYLSSNNLISRFQSNKDGLSMEIGHDGSFSSCSKLSSTCMKQCLMLDGVNSSSTTWFTSSRADWREASSLFKENKRNLRETEPSLGPGRLKSSRVKIYVAKQGLGDLVLLPQLCLYENWNKGPCTIKLGWEFISARMLHYSIVGLSSAERFQCGHQLDGDANMIYYALLQDLPHLQLASVSELIIDRFSTLLKLYRHILLEQQTSGAVKISAVEESACVSCAFCKVRIFNRYLTCNRCTEMFTGSEASVLNVCMHCYAYGAGCHCVGGMEWRQLRPWQDLMNFSSLCERVLIEKSTAQDGLLLESVLKEQGLARRCEEIQKTSRIVTPKPSQTFTMMFEASVGDATDGTIDAQLPQISAVTPLFQERPVEEARPLFLPGDSFGTPGVLHTWPDDATVSPYKLINGFVAKTPRKRASIDNPNFQLIEHDDGNIIKVRRLLLKLSPPDLSSAPKPSSSGILSDYKLRGRQKDSPTAHSPAYSIPSPPLSNSHKDRRASMRRRVHFVSDSPENSRLSAAERFKLLEAKERRCHSLPLLSPQSSEDNLIPNPGLAKLEANSALPSAKDFVKQINGTKDESNPGGGRDGHRGCNDENCLLTPEATLSPVDIKLEI